MNKLLQALKNADIPAPNKDTETFRIVRWGKNNRYWLRKFDEGYIFGDFVNGISSHVFNSDYKGKRLEKAVNEMIRVRKEAEEEMRQVHEHAVQKAENLWNSIRETSEHPYLSKKKVLSHGLREYKGCLVIPLRDIEGKLWSLQFITKNSEKRFLNGGRKKGCYFLIGTLAENAFICEGYATGATIYECTGEPVVVAFDSGNLKPVAQALRKKYPNLKMILCADNDCYHENSVNPGIEKAKEVAVATVSKVVVPCFKDTSSKPTDFNDLFILEGRDAVNAILKSTTQQSPNNIPAGFSLSKDGLFFVSDKTNDTIKICDYISVEAFIRELDGSISRLIKLRDYRGDFSETIITSKMFANGGDQAKVHLISKGFIMKWNGVEKRKLMEYILLSIPNKEVKLVDCTGYCGNAYLRPDQVIGNEDNVLLSTNLRDDAFGTKGSLEGWIQNVSIYCVGNSRLMFAASLAFASLLLNPCNVQSGGFHLAGTSSTGKTTCLRVASSIFGSPQYLKTWRATDNALESLAFKRNDALLVLDELSEMSAQKAGNVAYMFSHGEGKDRLGKDCNLRETFHWRTLFLSSGEVDLVAHLSEVDNKSKAGQEMRFISIPSNSINRTNGLFENLHGFSDVSEFGKHLQDSSAKYYGYPSIEFVKHILKEGKIEEKYNDELKRLKIGYLPENPTSQDNRVFERFMFVGFAGELATRYGLTGWLPGEAYQSALTCFQSWLKEKGGVGDLEEKRLMEQVLAFFETHVSSRFFDLDSFPDQRITNLAGYKRKTGDDLIYYVTTSVFKNEICKGFNRNYAIETLQKNQILQGCQQKWTPHGNKRMYVFVGKNFVNYEG